MDLSKLTAASEELQKEQEAILNNLQAFKGLLTQSEVKAKHERLKQLMRVNSYLIDINELYTIERLKEVNR